MSTIKSLSDKELLAEILKLRRREHTTTLEILVHLNEIERRRLHLKLGYSSLFDYCTKHLKYSASAAGRRIQTARCMRRYPEVYELLEQEKVNLMIISIVAPILNDENKLEILDAICNKTQREVEAIASQYRPPVELRDRVRPVKVHVPDHSLSGGEFSTSDARGSSGPSLAPPGGRNECSSDSPASSGQIRPALSIHSQTGSEFSTSYARGGSGSANKHGTRTEQKLLIQFLADEAFMKKYEEARSLLSQRLPDTSFSSVFDALMSEFLEHHSPIRKKARRDIRKMRRERTAVQLPKKTPAKPHQPAGAYQEISQDPPRHIPAAVRDEVFVRDKGRCTYVSTTGKRCESIQALQIDHIVPFARGGPTIAPNLRLLCAKHNRLTAEEAFGEIFTRQFRRRDESLHQRE